MVIDFADVRQKNEKHRTKLYSRLNCTYAAIFLIYAFNNLNTVLFLSVEQQSFAKQIAPCLLITH